MDWYEKVSMMIAWALGVAPAILLCMWLKPDIYGAIGIAMVCILVSLAAFKWW